MKTKKKNKIYGEKIALWLFLLVAVIALLGMRFAGPTEQETIAPQSERSERSAGPVTTYNVPLDTELQTYIAETCDRYGVDMPLVLAIIGQESNYNAHAVGDSGNSLGLMQIQARWHQGRMDRLGMDDLLDPHQNVTVGIDLLAELIEHGGEKWAVTAYNAGSVAADNYMAIGVTTDYAAGVMKLREDIENGR